MTRQITDFTVGEDNFAESFPPHDNLLDMDKDCIKKDNNEK
jgi:hypothetical protein